MAGAVPVCAGEGFECCIWAFARCGARGPVAVWYNKKSHTHLTQLNISQFNTQHLGLVVPNSTVHTRIPLGLSSLLSNQWNLTTCNTVGRPLPHLLSCAPPIAWLQRGTAPQNMKCTTKMPRQCLNAHAATRVTIEQTPT